MTSNALKIGLVASLAVNLFVIRAGVGVLGTQAHQAARKPPPRSSSTASVLMRAGNVLPEARRADYIARLKSQGELAKQDSKEARAARTKASDLIAAPVFEPAAILELLAEARNKDQASRARFEEAVIEFAGTLTPEERKVFGERLKPPVRNKDGRKGDDPKAGSPPPPKP